jgi:trans-aconitate methyltransferase
MTWKTYYEGRIGTGYIDYASDRYKPFLMALKAFRGLCRVIREEGCGIGTMSILYERITGQAVQMFDKDEAMVSLASSNLSCNHSNGRVALGDIRCDQAPVDLIFSHGVLEHFDERDIRRILSRQRRQARWVVHYVPTDQYTYKSFGDERLESADWWKRFGPADWFTFSQGKDLVLIFEGVSS